MLNVENISQHVHPKFYQKLEQGSAINLGIDFDRKAKVIPKLKKLFEGKKIFLPKNAVNEIDFLDYRYITFKNLNCFLTRRFLVRQ